jgi:hypothetical protein
MYFCAAITTLRNIKENFLTIGFFIITAHLQKNSDNEIYFGKFSLYSNYDIAPSNILHVYYKLQEIKQLFEYCKNDNNLVPQIIHNEQSLNGHFLLPFMSRIMTVLTNKNLEDTKYYASGIFVIMHDLKVHVIPSTQIVEPQDPIFKEIAIFLKLDLEHPVPVILESDYSSQYIRALKRKSEHAHPFWKEK